MAFTFPTSANQLQAFAGALYGVQIGSVTMAQVTSDIAAVGGLDIALNNYYASSFSSVKTASVAASMASNLGLTGDLLTEGTAYITAQLTAAAPEARGVVIKNILSLFSGLASDATFGAAATAWNAKVAAAATYSGASDVTMGSTASEGKSFTLTTGSNAFTGTSGGDTFDAGLSTGSLQTLNSGDRLDGGLGTDELFAVVNSSVTPASIKDIENISITTTAAATLDLTNATGVTKVVNQGAAAALTLSGVATSVGVTVQDTAIAGQVVTYSGVTGTADSATVTLQNVTGAATLSAGGIETLNIVTAGTAANTLANLTDASTATLNISGTSALNVTLTGAPAVRTIDASNLAAALTVAPTTALAATVTGGAGNDAITLTRIVADSVAGGAGNDTITFTGAGTLTVADSISAGDGTDTLVGNITDLAALTTATVALRTGFERITVSDALGGGALTTANVQAGIERVNLATTGSGTVTMEAGAKTISLSVATGALTVNDTGVAATDSLTITNSAAATDVFAGVAYAINGYETVTLSTSGTGAVTGQTANTITLAGDSGTTTLNISGSNGFTTTANTGTITANVIDASGLTGTAALTMGAAAASVTSITGSLNADTLIGDTSSSISGGAGNDTITGGAGNDTLLGGDGADTITTGGGAGDSVEGGAGNDIVVATLTTGNVMVGGDGTDVLSLAATANAAAASGVSGFETLRSTAAVSQDLAVFLDNNTFTTLQGAVAGTSAFTNVGNAITALATTFAGNTSTLARLVDTTTNSLNVTLLGNAATAAITANDEETINLTTSSAVGATTLTALTATDLHTLNITGSNAITITTLNANSTTTGTTLTVNASASTGGVTLSAVNSTVSANITGSATASNNLTGSAGSDTIVGGAVADTIVGGVGFDVLTGGSGADTFTFASTATGTPSSSLFDTITDYVTGTDIIDGPGALTLVAEGAIGSGQAAISATGLATFNIADSTLALRIAAVEKAMTVGTPVANEAAVFNFGADSYVFISDGTVGLNSADVLIKLTGITVATGLTVNVGGDITAIA
jgi:Ca2+-binding RTX toxin-like protein